MSLQPPPLEPYVHPQSTSQASSPRVPRSQECYHWSPNETPSSRRGVPKEYSTDGMMQGRNHHPTPIEFAMLVPLGDPHCHSSFARIEDSFPLLPKLISHFILQLLRFLFTVSAPLVCYPLIYMNHFMADSSDNITERLIGADTNSVFGITDLC